MEEFSTPRLAKARSFNKHLCSTPGGVRSPAVHLPATPFLSRLGYGTGVNVYLYERSPVHGRIRSPWAVKKVSKRHAKTQFGKRLEEEARILRSLNHPNIIQFKAFKNSENGIHALLMENGQKALSDLIDERNDFGESAFSAKTILFTADCMANALHYLHIKKHIMHGDIKSGNVLVIGEFDNIKLCDFGVTVPLDSNGLQILPGAQYVGTEAWSPKEVIMSEEFITSKADMFAFGSVLFEMIALHAPHVDKLVIPENSDDDDTNDDDDDDVADRREAAFQEALGSRPLLPDTLELDYSYRKVLEIFFATTNTEHEKRPSAAEVLELIKASNNEENEDEILCINILPQYKSSVDDSSVIFIDAIQSDNSENFTSGAV